jgi:hypothetical protein
MRAVLAMLLGAGWLLLVGAGPASACSCPADQPVEEPLSHSDGAFVGVLVGRDDPVGDPFGPRQVVNHFKVERSVKGAFGERVAVEADVSGASCGLELEVGQRTGLLLFRHAGGWTSNLCSQFEPQALLAFAPAAAGAGTTDWGLIVLVGLLGLAVAGAVVLEVVHRRSP